LIRPLVIRGYPEAGTSQAVDDLFAEGSDFLVVVDPSINSEFEALLRAGCTADDLSTAFVDYSSDQQLDDQLSVVVPASQTCPGVSVALDTLDYIAAATEGTWIDPGS
jgi:hypothetical protein